MNLYQEIIFLMKFCKVPFVVENVISYYEPLIKPYKSERHYFWSNFHIMNKKKDLRVTITNSRASTRRTKEQYIKMLEDYHGFDMSRICTQDTNKIKYLSNCVRPGLGLHVFNCAFKIKQRTLERCDKV